MPNFAIKYQIFMFLLEACDSLQKLDMSNPKHMMYDMSVKSTTSEKRRDIL